MEQALVFLSTYALHVFILLLCCMILYIFYDLFLKAKSLRKRLQRQGINGPVPSLLLGNLPDIQKIRSMELQASRISSTNYPSNLPFSLDCRTTVIPHIRQWTKQYGKTFSFALGKVQILYTSDADLLKEMNYCTSLDLGKPPYLQKDRGPLLGKGILTSSRQVWTHQRKTIAPFMYPDKVKNMLSIVLECGSSLIKSWENLVKTDGGITDIRVDNHVKSFTSSLISTIMFGKNYPEQTTLFSKLKDLMEASGSPTVLSGHPFYSYFPTKKNRDQWRLAKEIHLIIKDAAKKCNAGNNTMIQILAKGAEHGKLGASTPYEFVVDNCKDICLPAMDVVGNTAIWGLMLLALHPEWQARVREEILHICGGNDIIPDAEKLNKMKALKMTVQEILRLYPSAGFIMREALADLQIGNLRIPKGVNIWTWPVDVHRDTQLWGKDALKFNPQRFLNGISGACKVSQAYMPFGLGSRICPGKNLGILALTIMFALVLQKFSLSLSSNYRHIPRFDVLLEPKYGLNLLVRKL